MMHLYGPVGVAAECVIDQQGGRIRSLEAEVLRLQAQLSRAEEARDLALESVSEIYKQLEALGPLMRDVLDREGE